MTYEIIPLKGALRQLSPVEISEALEISGYLTELIGTPLVIDTLDELAEPNTIAFLGHAPSVTGVEKALRSRKPSSVFVGPTYAIRHNSGTAW
ncbi:hypothetical protein [Rhizobium sp. BK251]|uniref:hypothetical protein n=1 Tax=Rhizobium sp. BK251 TaxID=2512125 RepID=UPI00104C7108|nr:hypothetical protein [Rhizobium sp. BK251]TCL70459.1 hypothetical protein EV286_107333 [Rhizobium sp. BK251]